MAKLRLISFWPPAGFPDRPWLEDPDEDAFVRAAPSVCELYGEAVREAGISTRSSELRLVCHHDSGREDVLVTVHPDLTEGFELAVVQIPDGIAELSAAARSVLVLEVVHAAATRLGGERGWDTAALQTARTHVLAAGLRYRWEGPAKTSPDRRHTAQPVFALYDDGCGRVSVRVRRRADDKVVAASPPMMAFSTSEGFARAAKTLRWRSRTIVDLIPYAGLFGDNQGLATVDLDALEPPGEPIEPPLDAPHDLVAGLAEVPTVVVRTHAQVGPRIEVIGVGPTNDVPMAYHAALDRLLDQVCSPPWQTWWMAGTDLVLESGTTSPAPPPRSPLDAETAH